MSKEFKFNLSKPIVPYMTVEVPVQFNPTLRNPGRRGTKQVEVATSSVDVAELRRQWTDGADESFRTWAYSVPDEVFVRFTHSVRDLYMRQSWEAAVKTVLSLRGGNASYHGKISMDELESSATFQNLSTIDQKSARWIVENQDSEFKAKS